MGEFDPEMYQPTFNFRVQARLTITKEIRNYHGFEPGDFVMIRDPEEPPWYKCKLSSNYDIKVPKPLAESYEPGDPALFRICPHDEWIEVERERSVEEKIKEMKEQQEEPDNGMVSAEDW